MEDGLKEVLTKVAVGMVSKEVAELASNLDGISYEASALLYLVSMAMVLDSEVVVKAAKALYDEVEEPILQHKHASEGLTEAVFEIRDFLSGELV